MNSKLILLLVALTGQSVLSRPDSYESLENLGQGSFFGSSEEGSIDMALSSDENSSDEIPLMSFEYNPSKDGEPEAYLNKLKTKLPPGASFPSGVLEQWNALYKKSQGEPLPEPTAEQKMKIDMKLNKAELNRHNEIRQLHGAPPMEYDEKLAAFALNYAEEISAKMGQGYPFQHNPETKIYKIGENMASDGPMEAVWDPKKGGFNWGEDTWKPSYNGHSANMWYFTEIDNYKNNGNRPAENGQPATGHFTQVVWKKSAKMGCGMACYKPANNGGDGPNKKCNVICNYSPAGNMQGQENYDENVNMDMNEQGFSEMKAALTEPSLVKKLKELEMQQG